MLDDDSLDQSIMEAGRNGRMRSNHPYISAVAVVHRESHAAESARQWIAANRSRFDDPAALTAALLDAEITEAPGGIAVFLDVIETMSDSATPATANCLQRAARQAFRP